MTSKNNILNFEFDPIIENQIRLRQHGQLSDTADGLIILKLPHEPENYWAANSYLHLLSDLSDLVSIIEDLVTTDSDDDVLKKLARLGR